MSKLFVNWASTQSAVARPSREVSTELPTKTRRSFFYPLSFQFILNPSQIDTFQLVLPGHGGVLLSLTGPFLLLRHLDTAISPIGHFLPNFFTYQLNVNLFPASACVLLRLIEQCPLVGMTPEPLLSPRNLWTTTLTFA